MAYSNQSYQVALQHLCKIALDFDWLKMAYYCSGHGLRSQGADPARFLLYRAMSLSDNADERQEDCYLAALSIA